MTTKTKERMVSPGIVVDPDRFDGEPYVYGHRIRAARVASFALDGCRAVLIHVYGLTDNQIDDALRWDHEGRPS